jgi:hypothetical protein
MLHTPHPPTRTHIPARTIRHALQHPTQTLQVVSHALELPLGCLIEAQVDLHVHAEMKHPFWTEQE